VINLLQALRATTGLALLFISHDLPTVEFLCDRVVVMYLGRVMEIAPAATSSGAAAPLFAPPRRGRAEVRRLAPARRRFRSRRAAKPDLAAERLRVPHPAARTPSRTAPASSRRWAR